MRVNIDVDLLHYFSKILKTDLAFVVQVRRLYDVLDLI